MDKLNNIQDFGYSVNMHELTDRDIYAEAVGIITTSNYMKHIHSVAYTSMLASVSLYEMLAIKDRWLEIEPFIRMKSYDYSQDFSYSNSYSKNGYSKNYY